MPRVSQKGRTSLKAGGLAGVTLAFKILETLVFSQKACRVTDLAKELGTSKTRIFNHLKTLIQLGYVLQDPDSERYSISARLSRLGHEAALRNDLVIAAGASLRETAHRLGVTIALSKFEGEALYPIETIEPEMQVRVRVVTGAQLELNSTAAGKIALAFGPEDLLEKTIKRGLVKRTPQTIVEPAALRREVKAIRKQGWAGAYGQLVSGMNMLAVPVFDRRNEFVATVAFLSSYDNLPEVPRKPHLKELSSLASLIKARL